MKYFSYNPQTGELNGSGTADADQMDPGAYLLPAHSTDIEPPAQTEGHALVFSDGEWSDVVDNRGVDYWVDGEQFTISALGDEVPEGASTEAPEPEPTPVEELLAAAYAHPITGSDRLFLEAMRKRAAGDEAGAAEAEAAGLLRVDEIKALYN